MSHVGSNLRDAFVAWVEEGMPPLARAEVRYEPVIWTAEELLGRMCHCTDVMPRYLCDELDLRPGSTYAAAAQRLLAERKRVSAAS